MRRYLRQQLNYVRRDLGYLDTILTRHPEALTGKELERLAVIRLLYAQQAVRAAAGDV